jgi:hypothetical protein
VGKVAQHAVNGQEGLELLDIPLGEIDIIANSRFPGSSQQPYEVTAFSHAALASYEHHQTGVWVARRKSQKVIPIAGHQNCLLSVSKGQNRLVLGVPWQQLPQPRDLMARLRDHPPKRLRNIVVQQKSHAPASAICRATR